MSILICVSCELQQSTLSSRPPFFLFILLKELGISRQSALSVYLLFVNRETVQLPLAIPFKSHFKVESYYSNKPNYTVIGFLRWNGSFNSSLHQKVIGIHLIRSPEKGASLERRGR